MAHSQDSAIAGRITYGFMAALLWLMLIGVISGARSRTTGVLTGAAIGAFLGVMLAFPLLAIGLATS